MTNLQTHCQRGTCPCRRCGKHDVRTTCLRDDLLHGAKAAADYTGLTPRAIYHMVENGTIPHVRKGASIFFRKSQLDEAFRS